MEIRPLFVLLGLLFAAGVFAQAYTWTDENGVVHYSDRPEPGAEEIELGNTNAPRPSATPAPVEGPRRAEKTEPVAPYDSIEISSPGPEETLWNIETILEVNVLLTPPLNPGHQVRAYFDGMPQTFGSTRFTIEEVYRGVHNLQVEVIDQTGTLQIRSQPNRFYVQQNSVR